MSESGARMLRIADAEVNYFLQIYAEAARSAPALSVRF